VFPEVKGECEELNNSPQIEAAADGRPLTRYAANSRSYGAVRRVWRLGWRTSVFGDLYRERESLATKDGERESRETKDGERESLETKDGDRESLETKDGDRKRMDTSRARQECRVQKRITELHRTYDSPVNFGPGEEVPHLGSGAAHRRATSITGISGTAAVGGASIGSGT